MVQDVGVWVSITACYLQLLLVFSPSFWTGIEPLTAVRRANC